jgi:TorA-specific chaperone
MSQLKQETAQDTNQERVNENQARAMVYNFLSSLFAKEVTNKRVTQLTSVQGDNFLKSLAIEPSLAPYIEVIIAKLAQLNSEESLLELAADFCGLFLVDGKSSASPYAGQYLGNEQSKADNGVLNVKKKTDKIHLFGESHQLMSEFLTNSNMQIHSDFPEPADHLAVMLAYLAHLSLYASVENQLNFINTYLMTWLNDFTQQVKKHDANGFYSAVAEFTLEWVKLEINN